MSGDWFARLVVGVAVAWFLRRFLRRVFDR